MPKSLEHRFRSRRSEHGFTLVEMLAVTAVIGIMAATVIPFTTQMTDGYRLKGSAEAINKQISLARIRASAQFTRARIYADLSAGTSQVQIWDKVNARWRTEGGTQSLPRGVRFGFASITKPPAYTQAAIGQSPACTDKDGNNIANTACITFNSRGMPVDNTKPPTGSVAANNALYVTNGSVVYGITVTATPYINFWWSPDKDNQWVRQ